MRFAHGEKTIREAETACKGGQDIARFLIEEAAFILREAGRKRCFIQRGDQRKAAQKFFQPTDFLKQIDRINHRPLQRCDTGAVYFGDTASNARSNPPVCHAVVFKIPEPALAGHLRFVKDLIAVTVKLERAVIRHSGIVTDVRGDYIAVGNGLLVFQTDGNIQIPLYALDVSFLLILTAKPFGRSFAAGDLLQIVFAEAA